jgi:hypothetical protein
VADHPLRPATDRRLGEPLPHQPANQTRADPSAIQSFPKRAYPVLAQVSLGYSELKGTFPRVTHPSATDTRRCPFDLHVLSLPPAFVLSQDQTLKFKEFNLDCLTTQIDRAPLTPAFPPERCTHQKHRSGRCLVSKWPKPPARTPPPTLLSLVFTCQRASTRKGAEFKVRPLEPLSGSSRPPLSGAAVAGPPSMDLI